MRRQRGSRRGRQRLGRFAGRAGLDDNGPPRLRLLRVDREGQEASEKNGWRKSSVDLKALHRDWSGNDWPYLITKRRWKRVTEPVNGCPYLGPQVPPVRRFDTVPASAPGTTRSLSDLPQRCGRGQQQR